MAVTRQKRVVGSVEWVSEVRVGIGKLMWRTT
jgi:hypothetical protein